MRRLIATFEAPEATTRAVAVARAAGFTLVDAFSPYPLVGLAACVRGQRRIGWAACLGAAVGGVGVFALESFSAVIAYPFNPGGRPPFSWPVFLLAPFEIGVLFAGLLAFIAFLWAAGLPRLNHPAFDIEGIEQASQNRFILVFAAPPTIEGQMALEGLLECAVDIREGTL